MRFIDEFPHSYVLDVAPDWPERTERVLSFSPAHPLAIRSSVFHNIRFHPKNGDSWIAQFESSERDGLEDIVLSVPIPDQACVVSCGSGYWVEVAKPAATSLNLRLPISSIIASREHDLILISTWRDLYAHRSAEPVWTLRDIVDDELRITRIDDGILTATAFVRGADAELKIDVMSGKLLQFR